VRPHGRPCPRRRWGASARTDFYRGVNADAGGRPDEKGIRTVIFIQKRPL
jgi:hypothetical protein